MSFLNLKRVSKRGYHLHWLSWTEKPRTCMAFLLTLQAQMANSQPPVVTTKHLVNSNPQLLQAHCQYCTKKFTANHSEVCPHKGLKPDSSAAVCYFCWKKAPFLHVKTL